MFSAFESLHDEHIIVVREEPLFFILCSTRETSQIECVNLFEEFKTARANAQNLSYILKVNEFVALTNSEFMSRYTGYKSDNVWNGLKHVRTHEHGECSDPWSEL